MHQRLPGEMGSPFTGSGGDSSRQGIAWDTEDEGMVGYATSRLGSLPAPHGNSFGTNVAFWVAESGVGSNLRRL